MPDTLFIHIIYWIIILIVFCGYVKYKKRSKHLKISLPVEQHNVQTDVVSITPLEIKQILTHLPVNDNDWKCLESHINNYYAGFIEKLRIRYPLSNDDIRLIILICFGVSNRQIASYFNIQYNSLATHRYRIAKKMGLKGVKSINETLKSMLKNE